MLYALITHSL